MNLEPLRIFFGWCTILNAGLLLLSSLLLMLAGDWVARLHGRWFPMPREAFTRQFYQYLGWWKILVIGFNLVPWLALVLMT